jgi:hypothetical protein
MIVAAIGAAPATAQNVSGVMGPVVRENQSSIELRTAMVTELDGAPNRRAARIHYQRSLNGAVAVRGVVQGLDDRRTGFRLNALQGEVLWQITPDGQPLQIAVRADARIGWNGASDSVALNLAGEYRIDERWSVRSQVRSIRLIGTDASQALQWQTRGSVMYKLKGADLALDYFGSHGSFGDNSRDAAQAGPAINVPVGQFYVRGGLLARVSGRVPDNEARLWMGYRF